MSASLSQRRFALVAALGCVALALSPVQSPVARGQTLTLLGSFNGGNGANPFGDLTLIGSTLYGTTAFGGAGGDGAVFSIPVGGGTPTALGSFNGSNGEWPYGSLTLIGSTLYGTTTQGGASGDGAVFALNLAPTPEPSTLVLLGAAALGLAACRRRWRLCGKP